MYNLVDLYSHKHSYFFSKLYDCLLIDQFYFVSDFMAEKYCLSTIICFELYCFSHPYLLFLVIVTLFFVGELSRSLWKRRRLWKAKVFSSGEVFEQKKYYGSKRHNRCEQFKVCANKTPFAADLWHMELWRIHNVLCILHFTIRPADWCPMERWSFGI